MGENVSTITSGQRIRGSERLSGRKTVNERSLGRAVKRWERMTDENRNGEARQSIAKYFKYKDIEDEYKFINGEHNRIGYLNGTLQAQRRATDDKMFERIKKDYGEATLRKVYRGL